jgi:hypothetical protein
MLLLALAAALMLQVPQAATVQVADTAGAVYDSPGTRELVERTIRNTGEPPVDLRDYRADVHSSLFLALAPDTLGGGDLPASVDEVVSEVRWNQQGFLHQEVRGQRTRVLVPVPYTLGTLFQSPWVIPHLYGSDIFAPFAGPRAVNPFGVRGPQYYRYETDDPLRIRVEGELVTLIPVTVRPRVESPDNVSLIVGTFYVDEARAAVARARFGFAGRTGGLPRTLGQVETFLELENGLWEGRYWLPFVQRREILMGSRLLGGEVVVRSINRFMAYDFNTGWSPTGQRIQLVWSTEAGQQAFADWERPIGADAALYSADDFADLRLATATLRPGRQGWRPQYHYERGRHLFRYNRVEGLFLGVGARLVPPDPRRNRFELYGTAGWAFAEGTPRGELSARWGGAVAPDPTGRLDPGLQLGAYRRLVDIQPFRPTFVWDWIYTLPPLIWGSDPRDYYDAAGAELTGSLRSGRWSGRLGGRWEQHDSVAVNTGRFLFGTAGAGFGPLASVEPGRHLALEVGGGYTVGPGAFGIGNSTVLRAEAEAGLGDFRFNRVNSQLSVRYNLDPLTFAARVDGGYATGGVPPQKLFRFGGLEGLRGYPPNEFGGSSALLARSRVLVGIPPRDARPLARSGMFILPPLRPAVVLLGETGWTRVDPELQDALLRLRARPTDGFRSAVGLGVSIFDDAITLERLQPVGETEGARARWYFGLSYWY